MPVGSFHVAVWGCQMNVYDADRIRDLLASSGYMETSQPDNADIIVLVTCAVRAKAEDKVFNQIASWKAKGIINENTVIALGGCVGSELAQDIIEFDKNVNIVFGPRTVHRLPDMIREFLNTGKPIVDVKGDALEKFDSLPNPGRRGPSAFVTIMEGCSNKCSYCIVPYTRGEEESRPEKDILDEIKLHIANGVKEIHLLGQNVNSYRGISDNGFTCSFSELLYEIAAINGVERLRFTTSNPMEFTDDIVQAFADLDVIADAVHIPVQSGSDRILELMRRRYTSDSYRELIELSLLDGVGACEVRHIQGKSQEQRHLTVEQRLAVAYIPICPAELDGSGEHYIAFFVLQGRVQHRIELESCLRELLVRDVRRQDAEVVVLASRCVALDESILDCVGRDIVLHDLIGAVFRPNLLEGNDAGSEACCSV